MSHNTNKITNNLTVKSVSRAHNVPEDTILQQLLKGIDIELESTSNQDLAYSIALDNLFKVKDYYDKLERLREYQTNKHEYHQRNFFLSLSHLMALLNKK